eukprot:TRINITY_DN6464_c0_g2_i1.p2 TRINITY_DN6464_c0_g2~~TRINITY_DN6464_c0_g2_i1.p2  ORF type:complete len:337 (+),score=143.74 TRINITY_DN6464_c0_g2_i1:55-1011(+)
MASVSGYDFESAVQEGGVNWEKLSAAYKTTGLQGTEIDRAVETVKRMVDDKRAGRCPLVLAFTSNLISSGLREVFTGMTEAGLLDAVITTAGGVEEDFIKCLGPTVLGDFSLDGANLRSKGLNRIANLLVPNDNYCKFEDWFSPILTAMRKEQDTEKTEWTPSSMIDRLGKEIGDGTSLYNQCHAHGVPVFCPSLSDGSIGDMLYFHAFKEPGLVLDSAADLGILADTLSSKGAQGVNLICLGGGLPKYHSLMGCQLAGVPLKRFVLINTGLQHDGSETGKSFEDDICSGAVPEDCDAIRLHLEATIAFPIVMQRALQ